MAFLLGRFLSPPVVATLVILASPSLPVLQAQELPRSLDTLRYVMAEEAAPTLGRISVSDSTLPRTYWLEGAVIGALGALVGGQFNKRRKAQEEIIEEETAGGRKGSS